MSHPVFVDTSGLFALLDNRDKNHGNAWEMASAWARTGYKSVTTDHVISETYTLMNARGLRHLAGGLQKMIATTRGLQIKWTTKDRFLDIEQFFLKHADKGYSFTDCLSFIVMHDLKLTEALTSDNHFEQAGFIALLAESKPSVYS